MPGPEAQFLDDIRPLFGQLQVLENGIDDGVAGDGYPGLRDALAEQYLPGPGGRREKVIGNMVGEDAVDLLRHAAVVRAQPGFHVADLDTQLGGRQGPGQDAVGIPLDDHDGRIFFPENLLGADEYFTRLFGVGAGTGIDIILRRGKDQLLEEDLVQLVGIVLAGMQHEEIRLFSLQNLYQWGQFYNLRSGAEDNGNFHRADLSPEEYHKNCLLAGSIRHRFDESTDSLRVRRYFI